MNLLIKQKQSHKFNQIMVSRGRMWGRDSQGVWNGHVHTAGFKMDSQQRPTVWHMELCSLLCCSLDGRGVWGKIDICIYMAEFLHCSPETITTLLISCIWAFLMAQQVKNPSAMQETQETWVRDQVGKIPWKRKMATHSNILAWKMLWTEELGGLQSRGSQRVRHD